MLVFLKAIIGKNRMVTFILLATTIITSSFIYLSIYKANVNTPRNYIPKNIIYIYDSDGIPEKTIEGLAIEKDFKYYKTVPSNIDQENIVYTESICTSDLMVNLQNMDYVSEASTDLKTRNQKKINSGTYIENYQISYNFNSDIISNRGINIPNVNYGVNNIITGSYPTKINQVMIGENIANYYSKKFNVKSYEDLLGEQILINTKDCNDKRFQINEYFEISGVYQVDYSSDEIESLIINPNEEVEGLYLEENKDIPFAYFIEGDNYISLKRIISKYEFSNVITYHNYIRYNIYITIFIIFILENIAIFFIFLRNIKNVYSKLTYYGNKKLPIILYSTIPFVLINTTIFILLSMLITIFNIN